MNFINTYMDIIIFAVIAIILLFRLRSVFGQRQDQDPGPLSAMRPATRPMENGDIQKLIPKNVQDAIMERWAQNTPNYALVSNATTHHVLIQFPAFDPAFRPDDFLDKAKKAFVLVIQAFSEGNKASLEFLLSPKLQKVFYAGIDARDGAKESLHTQFHGILSALIVDAELDGSMARVTVEIASEQSITRKNADGEIIDGLDGHRQKMRDRWVFSRDLKSPSPAWLLEDTLPLEE